MEQMYMIEVFIDKISVFRDVEDMRDKQLTATVKFGPHTEFIMNEGDLSNEVDVKEETDNSGREMITRYFRLGKAYLFPSFPDTVAQILDRYPLEISVWNDDEDAEEHEFLGTGSMFWDTEFYNMLRVTANTCKVHKPLSIKQATPLMDECCCAQIGTVHYIVRLTALGGSIMTTFQATPKNPDIYIFSTDKNESVYQCMESERQPIEPEPSTKKSERNVSICVPDLEDLYIDHANLAKRVITKIKMGDIKGPCGNVNCKLAQKIKTFLRSTEEYRKKAGSRTVDPNKKSTGLVCGKCACHKEKWYKEKLADNTKSDVMLCHGCGLASKDGVTCASYKRDDTKSPPFEGYSALAKDSLFGGAKGNKDSISMLHSGKVDKDCSCDPPRLKPLCGAYDCVCREEIENKVTRKQHKPFCPSYKHKNTCPVSTMHNETEHTAEEKDDEEKEEELPYGLPPIKLGPCTVIGKPCTTEGFAKIVSKTTTLGSKKKMIITQKEKTNQRVSCSEDFERIKAFLNDYMRDEGYIPDNRCFDTLETNPDQRRCCDKDQRASDLDGRNCCATHKERGFLSRDI